MNNLTTCTSPSGNDSVSPICPAHTLAVVVPPDWKQFVEACAEVENCTVNISAIARRAKKLLGGADGGQEQPMAVPHGWKLVPIEPTDQMVLAPGAIHIAGKVARIHRDVWKRMLEAAPAAPAAQGDAKELTEKVIRVLEGYAENYDMMSRIGKTGDVDCRSVAHDIRRNMVDGVRAAIASKRTGP